MGLKSLKQKIEDVISKDYFEEDEVLYLFVEMRKYSERSKHENLNTPEDVTTDENNFRVIQFFRNWIAHPKKDFQYIPQSVIDILDRVDNESADLNIKLERELFTILRNEIDLFSSKTHVAVDTERLFNNSNFTECLRKILHEQPVHLSDTKRVGYNDNLLLCVVHV